MTDKLMPASASAETSSNKLGTPSNKQRVFLRYYTGFFMDLMVLNFFAEYSSWVDVDTYTTSFLAALVLQVLLKVTIICEHKVLDWFKAKTGALMTFLKYFCAWLILFGSKFVILEVLAQAFGDKLKFFGIWHGIVTLIVVVVVMLLAEEIMVRFYRKLADKAD